jgi:GDP-L-fucose synthase
MKNKIYLAGHKGMVGSAILKCLKKYKNKIITKSKDELDLTKQLDVLRFLTKEKPDQIYIAAAKVGGIFSNQSKPAKFIYENIMIQTNLIDSAFKCGIKKILFLGSSCIYPKYSKQPIKETQLLKGQLEPTNEPYAIAKISGIKICESYNRQYGSSHNIDYRSIMPTNLYGPGDNYNLDNSHVVPALIRKFHEAKIKKESKVIVWGTGKAKREFLFVDDLAKASMYLMNIDKKIYDKYTTPMCSHINVGYGKDITIKELSKLIRKIVGYDGKIQFDTSKPDGTPRKLLNSSIAFKIGWKPRVKLEEGLRKTYRDFKKINGFQGNYER